MQLSEYEASLLRRGSFTLGRVLGRPAAIGTKLVELKLVKLHYYTNFDDTYILTDKGKQLLVPLEQKLHEQNMEDISKLELKIVSDAPPAEVHNPAADNGGLSDEEVALLTGGNNAESENEGEIGDEPVDDASAGSDNAEAS